MKIRLSTSALLLLSITLICVPTGLATAQESLRKTATDDDRQSTNIGNIGLTVSNFGTLGTRNRYWPNQPSCEFPLGSRIEHLYQAGLWVGARNRTTGLYTVSTGVTDRSGSSGEGYEYTSELGAGIVQRSTLSGSKYFDNASISHQDFVCDYTEAYTRVPSTGDSIYNHLPLGLSIHQESYAWNFPFANNFVVIYYTMVNTGPNILDSVYIGWWANAVVRNTNFNKPGSTGFFDRGGNGYDSTQRAMYTFEFDPSPGGGVADSYIGIKLLGTDPFPHGVDSLGVLKANTFYNAWGFRSSTGTSAYLSPTDDYSSDRYLSRYSRMTQSIPQTFITPLRTQPLNMTSMLSVGPFGPMQHGDTIRFALGIVCAKKVGTEHERFDSDLERSGLIAGLRAVQQLYNGEDLNGNNRLDPGEDLNGNGALNRFQLPSPPKQPVVRAEVSDHSIVIYWDRASAEESVDPVSRISDFEGYRIYRSVPGSDVSSGGTLSQDNLPLVGEFDRSDDKVGRNTGFGAIKLATPKKFAGDTTEYWYRFPPEGSGATHLNGWQYLYGVSAFDQGDSSRNVESLESAKVVVRAIPGTVANETGKTVGVYPNPYYGKAIWDGGTERTRKIYFTNLPAKCTITIYTIAGDVVAELEHEGSNLNGQDIDWFQQYSGRSEIKFAGGEHAWNLITKYDQALASGLYLFVVKNKQNDEISRGKFLVVK